MAVAKDDWDRHWDDYSESAEHNPAQLYRRRLVFWRLGDQPDRVLDIGSGQGDLAASILARFPNTKVVGIEGSLSGVATAAAKVPAATFVRRDLLEPSPEPGEHEGWATHAVCSEVLEHVDDPVLLLRHARRYMSPGCRVVVTVPAGPMSAFDRHIGHRMHYGVPQLKRVLEAAGFAVDEVVRAGFPFFNLYRLLVVLRGDRLVEDVRAESRAGSWVGRVAMSAFRPLFRANLDSTPWGWQLVATARVSDPR